MLYVLPPPRAPDPPSPWDSILCSSGSNSSNTNVTERTPWADVKQMKPMKPPPGSKVLNLKNKSRANDSAKAVPNEKDDNARGSKSLSECYFAGKGTALVLPPHDRLRPRPGRRASASQGSDIQQHLQSMFYLLRPEDTLKMAVKLESVHPCRTRYLVVVSCVGRQEAEESCLLGIDCNDRTTIGLVLRVLADTTITLDGDGGFSVTVCGSHHIFKPVSVQAMWSALQTLHKISSKAREQNYFQGGPTHDWVNYYDQRIESDRSCLNEWHAMDSLESRRPPSPDSIRTKPRERDEAELIIRATLKEIMMSVDLDEVTSKCIRNRLEEDLNMNLAEYKSFIDQEMLTILGQMDSPTEIFDHVYLGSEWNASNFEELQKNGVGHILNVTREIDNFFPGMFDYLNIRVYDDEKTDLLKYWDNTFKYITKAKKEGSKVLVHCKMGVSRSASVVIAYAMKAYNWNFEKALKHVKEKRSCIKPNTSFLAQLETYQGILDAMKNKEKLQRSKSETNLKSPELVNKNEKKSEIDSSTQENNTHSTKNNMSGRALKQIGTRPKSWSPDNHNTKTLLLEQNQIPAFLSLENLSKNVPPNVAQNQKTANCNHVENARNVLMPFNNGQSYSVSPNQIVHIPGSCTKQTANNNKQCNNHDIKNENKSNYNNSKEKKGMVLNLTTQFEADKSSSPTQVQFEDFNGKDPSVHSSSDTASTPEKEIWDPGESRFCNSININTGEDVVWTSSAVLKQQTVADNNVSNPNLNISVNKSPEVIVIDNISKIIVRKEGDPFSNRLDRVFDREERKQQRNSMICPPTSDVPAEDTIRKCPSRQSSWSSYDSAVVLGYQGETRDVPSRHSSWGSGDTRTLPSRNSSWGSYDMRRGHINHPITEKDDKTNDILNSTSSGMFPYDRDEIPWYPGTVRRTKQKLENSSDLNKRVCSVPKNLDTTSAPGSPNNIQNHKSPSIETLSDFPISNGSTQAFNNGIVHYRSSPILCSTSTKKCSSENISKTNKTNEIDIVSDAHLVLNNNESRLSVSAPGSSSLSVISNDFVPLSSTSTSDKGGINNKTDFTFTSQCPSQNKISDISSNKSDNLVSSTVDSNSSCVQGIVKNLKKEFEAKTNIQPDRINGTSDSDQKEKLPSSNTASSPKICTEESSEDISVKELVGKYEVCKSTDDKSDVEAQESTIFKPKSPCNFYNKNNRYSCIEVLSENQDKDSLLIPSTLVYNEPETNKNLDMRLKKPHISPSSQVADFVVKAAAKKQLQLRNRDFHTNFNMKTRNNHSTHNTM